MHAATAGSAGTLVFSHANGFPAGSYRPVLARWQAAGYRIRAIERIGHDPRYPVTNNWPHLVEALLQVIDDSTGGTQTPVDLVGHSLGGYLSLLAAAERPTAVRSVVLLDSPVLAGWRAEVLRWIKHIHVVNRLGPGSGSARRRTHWPDAAALQSHFAAKPAFAAWDPLMLQAYLDAGFAPSAPGRSDRLLHFDRGIETAIYDTLPDNLWRQIQGGQRLPMPVAFIGGRRSGELGQVGMAATIALTQGRLQWIDGSHLFPMEHPVATAEAVLAALRGMR
jgi:pimeloyl-ACP methyl ester carboxylesterase